MLEYESALKNSGLSESNHAMIISDLTEMKQCEWLETDGLGGFASGTVSGVRTRRYHALLLTAKKPPTGRFVLVNGFDAFVNTGGGELPLSSQLYPSDVLHPDGASRIVEFQNRALAAMDVLSWRWRPDATGNLHVTRQADHSYGLAPHRSGHTSNS